MKCDKISVSFAAWQTFVRRTLCRLGVCRTKSVNGRETDQVHKWSTQRLDGRDAEGCGLRAGPAGRGPDADGTRRRQGKQLLEACARILGVRAMGPPSEV